MTLFTKHTMPLYRNFIASQKNLKTEAPYLQNEEFKQAKFINPSQKYTVGLYPQNLRLELSPQATQ